MNTEPTNENLVVVEWCESPFAANALVALLAEYDIRSYGPDMAMAVLTSASGMLKENQDRFPVFVLESEHDVARSTIDDARLDATEIDWDTVDVGDRVDTIPLKKVSSKPPLWLKPVAVAGLVLLGLTVAGGIVFLIL